MNSNDENKKAALALLAKAKQEIADNMASRGFAAIIWDNANAGFRFIPEIVVKTHDGKATTRRIMGLYRYNDTLYAIQEDVADIDFNKFYDKDSEVRPIVVTLPADEASRILGDPKKEPGYTTQGSIEEWLAIADCYFQALEED